VIDVDARPRLLVCERAMDVTVIIVNRSDRPCYSIVLELEPDPSMRLVGGDPHIEIDELQPGMPYPHRIRLTGRAVGTGWLGLANFSYRNGHGTPVRFPLRPLEFKVQCGPPRPHPEQRRQASPSILPTAFVSHRRIESGWLAEFLSAIFLDCYAVPAWSSTWTRSGRATSGGRARSRVDPLGRSPGDHRACLGAPDESRQPATDP